VAQPEAAENGAAAIDDARIESPPAPVVEHIGGKSRQQLAQGPTADPQRDQQHQKRGNPGVRRGVADTFPQVGGEELRCLAGSATVGATRMRASATRNAT